MQFYLVHRGGTAPTADPPGWTPEIMKNLRKTEISQHGRLCRLGLAHLGPSWAHVGPSWAHVGAMFGHVGAMLAHLGAMLKHLTQNVEKY